jgi:hypothetical protein
MILMRVVARRRKDEVWRPIVSHVLQDVLDVIPDGGEATLGEVMEVNGQIGAGNEGARGFPSLGVTLLSPSEDNVPSPQSRVAFSQGEQSPTGSDLNVVRMRADRQDGQFPLRRRLDLE